MSVVFGNNFRRQAVRLALFLCCGYYTSSRTSAKYDAYAVQYSSNLPLTSVALSFTFIVLMRVAVLRIARL
jgi:hypothetical protein